MRTALACLLTGLLCFGGGAYLGYILSPASLIDTGMDALAQLAYDSAAEARYRAEVEVLDARIQSGDARVAQAEWDARQARIEAEHHRRNADQFEAALVAAATADEAEEQQAYDLVSAALAGNDFGAGLELERMRQVWRRRVEQSQEVARYEREQARLERVARLAEKARGDALSEQLDIVTEAMKHARERADYLSRPRWRWGPGITAGAPVLPRVDFSRPTAVAGISFVFG